MDLTIIYFSVPVKKEVKRTDENEKEIIKTKSHSLQFNGGARFMFKGINCC